MDPMYSFQDVIRCGLCETPVPPKHCELCHIHLCEACVGEHLSDQSKEHCIVPFKMKGSIDSLQDVIRCRLCETPVPPKHCDICQVHLCEACVGEHLSDESKDHYIVPFKLRGITPVCQTHSSKLCKLYCTQCNIPVCRLCFTEGEHQHHDTKDLIDHFIRKIKLMEDDLKELENCLLTRYHHVVSHIMGQKIELRTNYKKLTKALKKQQETLHKEIDTVIGRMQTDIFDMEFAYEEALKIQENVLNHTIIEMSQVIQDLKNISLSKDYYTVCNYNSKIEQFRRVPLQPQVSLTTFTPQEINQEQIYQQIGFLSLTKSSSSSKTLMDKPQILTDIQTEYGGCSLRSVSCLSENKFWTSCEDEIIRLHNLKGELLKSVQTSSHNRPRDIAVTASGALVYTDYFERTINMVNDGQEQVTIRLTGWRPRALCSTLCGDLLVVIDSVDDTQAKVVRYSGSKEKQSIQYDDNAKSLYTAGPYTKYISENRNLDICVADCFASAVVVVSATGKFRFRYTSLQSFYPCGIATDSLCNILTASNDRIWILDRDGQFVQYIAVSKLIEPCGLCVDSKDNVFVAEWGSGQVKKIQFYI